MNSVFVRYMSMYADRLLHRESLISMIAQSDLPVVEVVPTITMLKDTQASKIVQPAASDILAIINSYKNGDIVKLASAENKVSGFAYKYNEYLYYIEPSKKTPNIPFDIYDEIEISRGDIINWLGPKGTSTIGRYILNYTMLASIFGNKIEYVNDVWKIGKIEDRIAKGLISNEFTVAQYDKYIEHGYFIGHSAELCVPTITRRSFTTDPKIAVRKKELLEKYKGQLNDPNVIAVIEDELLKMDKEWLAGDESLGFHEGIGGKSFEIHRKKMLLTVGGIEVFDADGGAFNFVGNSLSEGWDKKDFPAIANDIRKGSYARGAETWKGGALTKFILRVFQDVKIVEDDCNTTRGIKTTFTEDILKALIGRTIITGGKQVIITEENYKQFAGKEVSLRSPTYCETGMGLCYTCCGENFRSLGVEAIGPLAVEISSRFMMASMKSMHGTKLKVIDVDHTAFFV